jgi:hypothetical protein
MNRYGIQAMRHWQQTDPQRFSAIPDREAFFTALGEEAEREIQARAAALAGPDRPGEAYLEKVGRWNMARFTAESEVLRELVLIPDPGESDEAGEEPAPESWNIVSQTIQEMLWEEEALGPD